jgi:hypothetical protein
VVGARQGLRGLASRRAQLVAVGLAGGAKHGKKVLLSCLGWGWQGGWGGALQVAPGRWEGRARLGKFAAPLAACIGWLGIVAGG